MALVTEQNRETVRQFRALTVEVKTTVEDMLVLLKNVDLHIAAANTAPGAGDEADWDEIVAWYLPLYQAQRDVIVAALANLPDL